MAAVNPLLRMLLQRLAVHAQIVRVGRNKIGKGSYRGLTGSLFLP